MTKILSIAWYKVLPSRYGGQKGTALFNKYLGKLFPLICLCSRDNPDPGQLSYKILPRLPVSKLQFIDPFCWIKIYKTAKKEQVSHVILEHPYHGISGWILKKFLGIILIVHSHNIESERFKEQGKWWWWILQILEKWTYKKADINFFKTPNDELYAIKKFKLKDSRCRVIPFGIEVDLNKINKQEIKSMICERHSIDPGDKIILFAGTLDYKPNADAVVSIYKEIAPRLSEKGFNFKIILCGRNYYRQFQYLDTLYHLNVLNVGEVSDIHNYFSAADVLINPVMRGSGMQTKVIEALSYHLNSVVFKQQLQGINENVCGKKIFPADDRNWNDFIKQIIDASEGTSITPELFFNYYSWTRIIEDAAQVINEL